MKFYKKSNLAHTIFPHLFLSNTSAWTLYFLCPCWIYPEQKSTLALSIQWRALDWKGASDGQTSGEVTGERATDHSNSSRPSMVSWHPSIHRSHQKSSKSPPSWCHCPKKGPASCHMELPGSQNSLVPVPSLSFPHHTVRYCAVLKVVQDLFPALLCQGSWRHLWPCCQCYPLVLVLLSLFFHLITWEVSNPMLLPSSQNPFLFDLLSYVQALLE